MDLADKLFQGCIDIIKSDSMPGFVCIHQHHKAVVGAALDGVVSRLNAWIESQGSHFTNFNGDRRTFPSRSINLALSAGPKRIMKKLTMSECLVSDGQENPKYVCRVTIDEDE